MEKLIVNGVLCISSLEIAKLTGKRHDHVMRDINTMLEELGIDAPKFGGIYLDTYKREKPMFSLPEREAMVLASGYDVKLRAKLVDYFLEGHQQPLNTRNTILNAVVANQIALDKLEDETKAKLALIEDKQETFQEATVVAFEQVVGTVALIEDKVDETISTLTDELKEMIGNGQGTMVVKQFISIMNLDLTSKEFNELLHNNGVFDNTLLLKDKHIPNKPYKHLFKHITQYNGKTPYKLTVVVTGHALELYRLVKVLLKET